MLSLRVGEPVPAAAGRRVQPTETPSARALDSARVLCGKPPNGGRTAPHPCGRAESALCIEEARAEPERSSSPESCLARTTHVALPWSPGRTCGTVGVTALGRPPRSVKGRSPRRIPGAPA